MAEPTAEPAEEAFSTGEDFSALLDESFGDRGNLEGSVVDGIVIATW